jgi:hypothetical protein
MRARGSTARHLSAAMPPSHEPARRARAVGGLAAGAGAAGAARGRRPRAQEAAGRDDVGVDVGVLVVVAREDDAVERRKVARLRRAAGAWAGGGAPRRPRGGRAIA